MYAIVEIAGQQFKVAKDQKLFVHRLKANVGESMTFDRVLLIDDGKVTIGAPAIEGAGVTAKILQHLKGDKVIVFKKKRRRLSCEKRTPPTLYGNPNREYCRQRRLSEEKSD